MDDQAGTAQPVSHPAPVLELSKVVSSWSRLLRTLPDALDHALDRKIHFWVLHGWRMGKLNQVWPSKSVFVSTIYTDDGWESACFPVAYGQVVWENELHVQQYHEEAAARLGHAMLMVQMREQYGQDAVVEHLKLRSNDAR